MAAVVGEMECGIQARGGKARTEIEIEEEINKGDLFIPDTDVVLLLRSNHLRHNAPVSTAHTTSTLNKRYSLYGVLSPVVHILHTLQDSRTGYNKQLFALFVLVLQNKSGCIFALTMACVTK